MWTGAFQEEGTRCVRQMIPWVELQQQQTLGGDRGICSTRCSVCKMDIKTKVQQLGEAMRERRDGKDGADGNVPLLGSSNLPASDSSRDTSRLMTPAKGQAGSFSGDFISISASVRVVVSLMAAQMRSRDNFLWPVLSSGAKALKTV
ncbi:hypothetical protein ACRRTK_014777 [Alexandromys fortis]